MDVLKPARRLGLRGLSALLWALTWALSPLPAMADNPVNGASLYAGYCSGCHGSNPLTFNSNKIYYGRNSRAALDASISIVGQMTSLRSAFPSGGSQLADVAAYLGNTPTSLTYASTAVGSTSGTQAVTVTASLVSGYSISSLSVATSGDFARSGGTCGTTVAIGSSCTVLVAFTPTAAGTRTGTLSLTHSNTLTPVAISLSGTATATTSPAAAISSTALSLAATTVGSTSASQTLTLSNTGTAALVLSGVSISGTNASEFNLASGGSCAAGSSVAPSSSCTIAVNFTPAAAGSRSATLSIVHNAPNSPTTVAISGTGNAAPTPTLSINASSLAFGSQVVGTAGATQSVTVTNSGTAALVFTGLTLSGAAAADFSRSGTCSTAVPVAAGATCTLVLGFTPAATGVRSATLTVASNASNGSATLALSGTGTATPAPAVSLSSSSLAFGSQTVGTSSTVSAVTLTNTGSAALAISSIAASGSDFSLSHNCPSSLTAGSACTLSTVFAPTVTGARSGSLTITSNASSSPNAVSLSGTGAAVVLAPILAWTPTVTALDFGAVTVGNSSGQQTLTLANSGNALGHLTAISVSGTAPSDFALGAGTCAAGGTLAVGSACTVVLSFTPTAAGARNATLTVASDGTPPAAINLTGSATAAPAAALSLSPTAVSFSAETGTVATSQTLTLQNSGTAVLQVSQVAIGTGGFSVAAAPANGCAAAPFGLAPGASCALSLGWTSATNASESGSLVVSSNAPGATTTTLSLTGTHTTAAAAGPVNSGRGGCTLSQGDPGTDPLLPCLIGLAALVLWHRRSR
jgi:hypothetical protein